jgi:putative SOS response-associated peptidase YedK
MCGRYVLATKPQQLALDFGAALAVELSEPDYNVAPTKPVPAVLVREDRRVLTALRWGLVPFWAKDPSIGAKMINARIETAAEKPAFRRSLAKRRCLLPADGYFEWRAPSADEAAVPERGAAKRAAKPRKQPYYICSSDGGVLAFAGLYERWRDAEGNELWSASILTGAAAEPYAWIHDRMPLTVAHGDWEPWLNPALADPREAHRLLVLEPAWTATPVSDLVNSVRNNGPALIEPVLVEPALIESGATGFPDAGMGTRDHLF